jgi:hypothetical protein
MKKLGALFGLFAIVASSSSLAHHCYCEIYTNGWEHQGSVHLKKEGPMGHWTVREFPFWDHHQKREAEVICEREKFEHFECRI